VSRDLRWRRAWTAFGCLAVVSLIAVAQAGASYELDSQASAPGLRVDAKGDAEITWTKGGVHHSFVVPPSGPGYNGALPGADVSKPAQITLPMAVVVRQTPDGRLWALQQRTVAGRPTSLDFSRWHGAPTQLTLGIVGPRIQGTAMFGGKPVHGVSNTLAGRPQREYVYIECYGCPGHPQSWIQMLGVQPKANGAFSVYLRPSWAGKKYRATVAGPNVGWSLAPDAEATTAV
jgi:hypothetical protein